MTQKLHKIACMPIRCGSVRVTRILITVCCLVALPVPSALSEERPQQEKVKDEESALQLRGAVRFEYDDNVFRLNSAGKSRLVVSEDGNIASGRLDNMESISDRIISTNFELQYEPRKLWGRKATIEAEITYHDYQRNSASSYFDGQITLTRRLGKNGRVRAQTEFTLDRFRRNYLASVTDLNANGNIPILERQYARGVFHQFEPSIAYRHRLRWHRYEEGGWGFNVHVAFGALHRDYENPLANRDRDGMFGALWFEAELSRKLSLALRLRRENISTPSRNETILVDETRSGFNRNMNGDARIKANAPLNTMVDRSRNRNSLRFEAIWRINGDWRASIEYRSRKSDFTSHNPLDVDHYGATETEDRVSASLRWRLKKRWFVTWKFQRTDSEDYEDLGLGQEEYRQKRISLTIRHRLQ